jgi:hypothetical protein
MNRPPPLSSKICMLLPHARDPLFPSDRPFLKVIRFRSFEDEGGEEMKNSLATTYDMGKALGVDMRGRLEKNLKRYVIAGIIATGCGVFFIVLKLPLYIDFIGAFSSYLIANYSLSKVLKKNQ